MVISNGNLVFLQGICVYFAGTSIFMYKLCKFETISIICMSYTCAYIYSYKLVILVFINLFMFMIVSLCFLFSFGEMLCVHSTFTDGWCL